MFTVRENKLSITMSFGVSWVRVGTIIFTTGQKIVDFFRNNDNNDKQCRHSDMVQEEDGELHSHL